jgi:CheY-like chemotaxis protein
MLGHELRNPLSAIRNAVDLLQMPRESSPRAVEILDRQTEHMARIIDGLLDVSRIARGKLKLECSVIDLGKTIAGALEDRDEQIRRAGLSVIIRPATRPLWSNVDRVRIVQVVDNLLSNAIKFTPSGGQLVVTLRNDGDFACLSVLDSGVGIAADLRARLFEPFYQAPQELARSHGGLGLGLSLAKGLVELHGGQIEARSAGIGHGSEFIIRLPLAAEPQPTHAAGGIEPAPHVPTKILVVEDNGDAAQMLCALLDRRGHSTTVACDGTGALDEARKHRPHLVLCDIGLPGISGYEVARTFRADPLLRDIRLVALTGYGQTSDVQRSHQAGFDLHLTKPVDAEKLLQAIDQLRHTELHEATADATARDRSEPC